MSHPLDMVHISSDLRREWKAWALAFIAVLLGVDIASHLFNFPIRIVLLRIGLHCAETVWARVRMI